MAGFFPRGVVAFLSFCRRNVADGLQEPAIVEPFDPGQGGELDSLKAPPRSAPMDNLGLVEPVDRLGESVVVGIAHTADRALDACLRQTLGVADADILRALVGVMHEAAAMDGPPFVQGLFESIEDEARMGGPAYPPADDPAGIGIEDEGRPGAGFGTSRMVNMKDGIAHLPSESADLFTNAFARFLRIEALSGAVLLLCTIIALVLSNTPWAAQFMGFWELEAGFSIGELEFDRSLKHWVNDGLMTLFFFVVSLELKRELVLGELRHPRMAAFPLAAAFGGMIIPAGLFMLLVGSNPGASGWGAVMSTDTAFVIGCLAVLGSRLSHSLRLFLLSLAIFDDVGAILVVAVAYGDAVDWVALGLAAFGIVAVAAVARVGIRSIPVYFAMGSVVWIAVDASGVHATLSGVVLGLMTPARSWVSDRRLQAIFNRVTAHPPGAQWSGDTPARRDLRRAGVAAREALSPIERLEMLLHPWVAFTVMPLFALANAGVAIDADEFDAMLATSILVAFVVGKPVGIILFAFAAVKLRVGVRPADLPWSLLMGGSLLTGIGFTMALFIAELAFDASLLASAKLGILAASVASAAAGFLALAWLTSPGIRSGRSAA